MLCDATAAPNGPSRKLKCKGATNLAKPYIVTNRAVRWFPLYFASPRLYDLRPEPDCGLWVVPNFPKFLMNAPYTQPMLRDNALAGKTIVVTGGGTGLGRAMTTYFLQLGANVTITSRPR